MLSGIKRGKKKKGAVEQSPTPTTTTAAVATTRGSAPSSTTTTSTSRNSAHGSHTPNNQNAAAALKAALNRGEAPTITTTTNTDTTPDVDDVVATQPWASLPTLSRKREDDMTVTELAAYERRQHMHHDVEEEYRALWRSKKRQRASRGTTKTESDDEEEVERWKQQQAVLTSEKYQAKIQKRWQVRQVANHHAKNKNAALADASWWWMESSRFVPSSLVSVSAHVSLVLAPVRHSWHNADPVTYPHLYLVPVLAAGGIAQCCGDNDDETWHDVQRYQASLRAWATAQGKGVIFAEVVLPTTKASAYYQARMHAMIVPRRIHQDAALLFQSALSELLLEHGTHQTKIQTFHGTSSSSALSRLIPSHFAYIYVEYGGNGDAQGKVLLLEERRRDVTPDWAAEVLAGRLGLDPLRMRQRGKNDDNDDDVAARVRAFGETWNAFDWTKTNTKATKETDDNAGSAQTR